MDFVNNWSRGLTLALGATAAVLDLPDGTYRLTCADALGQSATRWECIDAVVAGTNATLVRGLEGTTDQLWPEGSVIYCSVTAAGLADLFAQLASLQARVAALEAAGIPNNALTDGAGNHLVDDQGNYLTGV